MNLHSSLVLAVALLAAAAVACTHPAAVAHSPGPVTTIPPSQLIFADGLGLPPLNRVGPKYPAKLLARGRSAGTVALFVVDTAGRVDIPSVRFSYDADKSVYESVCDALARIEFTPAQRDGEPRPVLMVAPYTFNTLSDTSATPPTNANADSLRQSIRRDGIAAALAAIAPRPGC